MADDRHSGRIFLYALRGQQPEDCTDKFSENNVESIFGWWHGPMACDTCEIVISVVLPLRSSEEASDADVWWQEARKNLFPSSLEGERCPECDEKTLRYHHIEGWYDEHPEHQVE